MSCTRPSDLSLQVTQTTSIVARLQKSLLNSTTYLGLRSSSHQLSNRLAIRTCYPYRLGWNRGGCGLWQ
eukprot:COSAG02_NODE_7621_length_2930_cov_15.463519_3_plen_69_part_00